MLLSAFILGLFSSLHCVSMCGPIALALGGKGKISGPQFGGRISYNLGRITTYTMLGGILELLGMGISLAGFQQGLSILLGISLIILILFTANWETHIRLMPGKFLYRLKQLMGSLLSNSSPASRFNIGILNGFLPCGFVYLALAGALAGGDFIWAMLYMMVFGLGTLPAMLGISLAGSFLPSSMGFKLRPILRGAALVFAFLLILRGMNLGIPYVSPVLPDSDRGVVECSG